MKLDLEYFRHALSKRKNDFLSKRAPTLARLSTALTGNPTIYKGQNGNELLMIVVHGFKDNMDIYAVKQLSISLSKHCSVFRFTFPDVEKIPMIST